MSKKYAHEVTGGKLFGLTMPRKEITYTFLGSSLSIALIGFTHTMSLAAIGLPLLMAPFAASAVLVFGAPQSPLAQPRNVLIGHVVSGITGVTIFQLSGNIEVLSVSLAVSLAILFMLLTKSLHPPGGATAFIAVAGGSNIHELGYWYVLMPCVASSLIMIAVAWFIRSVLQYQRYPLPWRQ